MHPPETAGVCALIYCVKLMSYRSDQQVDEPAAGRLCHTDQHQPSITKMEKGVGVIYSRGAEMGD